MLKAGLRRIKSAPRSLVLTAGIFLLAAIVGAALFTARSRSDIRGKTSERSDLPPAVVTLQGAHESYSLQAVWSEADQEKGLGGKADIPANQGMLFWFPKQYNRCFWMKDMQFSLDIVWVTSDHVISHIESDLSPATYPKAYCAQAKDVIELQAGTASDNGWHDGSTLQFR